MKSFFLCLFIVLFFNACASIPTVEQRVKTADNLIKNTKPKKEFFSTDAFSLYSLQKASFCKTLRVYIEGDGLSWITRTKISTNPTPINPLAMKLFLKDSSNCKIYLARPCQYTKDKKCEKKYWTSHRFSKEVLTSYLNTFDLLKKRYQNKDFELIGFSGGGAIATLISAKREDINLLVTVAGNLDHKAWTKQKRITPLYGSLNPINYTNKLKDIKQIHLIGGKDRIISQSIFNSYISYFNDKSNIKSSIYKDYTHQKGWEKNWKKIIKYIYLF